MEIEAVGKQLSSKNLDQLKSAWKALTALLLDSGNLESSDFPETLIDTQSLYDKSKKNLVAASGCGLMERVEQDAWFMKLENLMNTFRWMFTTSIETRKGDSTNELISELSKALQKLAGSMPEASKVDGVPINVKLSEVELEEESQESSEEVTSGQEVVEETIDEVTETESAVEEVIEDEVETEVEASAEIVERVVPDIEAEVLELEIHAAARDANPEDEIEIVASANNEKIIEGILFKVGKPSEAIPGVGPNLPLYIPHEVAREAIACISRLSPKPLDAHDSLKKHANREIVGAMHSARIDNDDFIVSGVLWDWSQPEKIKAISCAKNELGMSVNATAEGHPTKVGGTNVWFVDRLRILGANILYAENATYKQTRLVNAQAYEPAENSSMEFAIAASADESNSTEEVDEDHDETNLLETTDGQQMDTSFIEQLAEISAGISQIQRQVNQKFNTIEPVVEQLQMQLSKIESEREQNHSQIQAAAEAQAKEAERNELLQAIESIIDQRLKAKGGVRQATNVLPLAASASAPSGMTAIDLQLAAIEGELKGLQADTSNLNTTRIYELHDLKRGIEMQKQGY